LAIKEDSGESLDKMAVTLTQHVFRGPSYCAHMMGDGSNLAWEVIGRVIAASPIPVSGGHCSGFAVGMFVAQNNKKVITDITTTSQHFQRLLVLVSLQKQYCIQVECVAYM
jgi:hypothetical protein